MDRMLDGLDTEKLIALRAAVEQKLAQEQDKLKALAAALGGSCNFRNGARPKKKSRQHRNDDND
jgi:hypothetical protein